MEQYVKKSHIAPDDRRKERVSADTGHRKDVKKQGHGAKGTWGKEVPSRAPPGRFPQRRGSH